MGISGHMLINSSPLPGRWGPIGSVSGEAEFKVIMSRSFKGDCSRVVVGFFLLSL